MLRRNYWRLQRKYPVPRKILFAIPSADQCFLYSPIPKNGSTSIKQAFRMVAGHAGEDCDSEAIDGVHSMFWESNAGYMDFEGFKAHPGFKFAVIRHPTERVISCYTHQVLQKNELRLQVVKPRLKRLGLPQEPDVDFFIQNLSAYCRVNFRLLHHAKPQYLFLHPELEAYDRIYTMREMGELEDRLRQVYPSVTLSRANVSQPPGPEIQLAAESLASIRQFYAQDFRLFSAYFPDQDKPLCGGPPPLR